jgi:hypothetical protein
MFKRFLVPDLYNAYVGPSKNRNDFPVQIGALIRKFHFSKIIDNNLFLNGPIF